MPKITFTPQEIKAYWDTSRDMPVYLDNRYNMEEVEMLFPHRYDALHPFYLQSLRIAESMRVHADGFFPYRLIKDRRPNEPLEVETYRIKIFSAKTKSVFSKVLSSLGKIRRSADWLISYPDNADEFTKIKTGEDLKNYCEKNLPYYQSVTNWVFDVLLRKYLIDPNALLFVTPLEYNVASNEMIRPYPVIFDSINVLDYLEDDYAVMLNPWGATYYEDGNQKSGRLLTIVTTLATFRYIQSNSKGGWTVETYTHQLGFLPVFQLGGTIIEQIENQSLYESRIAGMVPELDEAIRENSDLQAVKVLHQYPERYEFTNTECKQCHGNGFIANPNWTEELDAVGIMSTFPCEACAGIGLVASGPFSKMVLKLPDATNPGQSMPMPPAGYIEKDTKIIEIQEASVKQHIADALAAINFDFLINVPLSQSGISKQYDRNESNNTSHAVAEDLVDIMDKFYKSAAYYRYNSLYPLVEIDKMLPKIPVPENYDLYSVADAQKSLNDAKAGKINPVIVNAMEKDYANKLFSANPDVRDRLNLIFALDPLPNITEDEKMSRLSNKGITQLSYVISSNIQEFVQQALEENENFADDDLEDQKKVMETMAQKVIDTNSATAKVISMNAVPGMNGLTNPDGSPIIPVVANAGV